MNIDYLREPNPALIRELDTQDPKIEYKNPLLWISAGYLVLCVLLGGSSSGGWVANAVLQALGVLIIAWLLVRGRHPGVTVDAEPFLLLGLGFVAIAIVQLIPLPPAVWTNLAGRQSVARAFTLLGLEQVWAPISLAPQGTIRAIVSAIPALAMFSLVIGLPRTGRRLLVLVFVGVAAISALYGVLQIGGSPALYFYAPTNTGKSVGFFANANHQATLLLVTIPLISASRFGIGNRRAKALPGAKPGALDIWLLGAAVLVSICAIATRSLAAVGLLAVAVIGTLLILRGDRLTSRSLLVRLGGGALLSILLLALGVYLLGRSVGVNSSIPTEGDRLVFAADTLRAIRQFGLFGSGLGTFVGLYPSYQDVATFSRTYVNHAHNDWIEWILETGLLGAALLVAFIAALARSALRAFQTPAPTALQARAAVVGIIIIGLHSLVDYPIRTAAIAATFAMLCGLLLRPPAIRI